MLIPSNGREDVTISVIVGETRENHAVHQITRPARLSVEEAANGRQAAVRIESEEGVVTTVRF